MPGSIPTALQPLLLQPLNVEAQSTFKQETLSSINNDRYEAIATTNAGNIYPFSEDVGIEKNGMTIDDPMDLNLNYSLSEATATVFEPRNKTNVLIATSTSSDLETVEATALQSSVETILAAAGTPEIHQQYELATIEEQPELGYQSDSSDTDSLLFSSRKKIINCNNGAAGQVLRKKASTAGGTLYTESAGILSSENTDKILAPVIEDSLEENDIWSLPHLK